MKKYNHKGIKLREIFAQTLTDDLKLDISLKKVKDTQRYGLFMGDEALNLIIGWEEMDRLLVEHSLGEMDAFNTLTDSIYQIYKARREHDDHNWNCMHDTLVHATNKTFKREQLEKILVFVMPKYLRNESYNWGMSDTPWGDNLHEWAIENLLGDKKEV